MPVDFVKIKTLRESRGLSQEEAATLAGLSGKQAWNAIERGRKPGISVDTLEKIAKALRCSPAELLTR